MKKNLNQVKTRLVGIKGFFNEEIREDSVLDEMRVIAKELKFVTSNEIEVCANTNDSDLMVATVVVGKMNHNQAEEKSTWIDAKVIPRIIDKMSGVGFSCSFIKVQDDELKVGFARVLDESDYV